MSLLNRIGAALNDSYVELTKKVTWPTRQELTSSAIVVMIASTIIAIFVLLVDLVFEFGLTGIYDILGRV
ncbi:MAG: preprotein translocase subunit SecE [Porphyromonadaceae bacterium]|nr:preprotein translocase subunit SecE [Porphyromonadaceae bacterium]